MATTKVINLSPNGNLIKMNGKIYRHYTRNITTNLPSIFYAINHGATVYEVLSNGDTVQLTVQNYALDNEKEIMRQKELEKMKNMPKNNDNLATDSGKSSESDFTSNELPESIEMNTSGSDISSSSDETDKNNQKKSNRKTTTKKTSVEE